MTETPNPQKDYAEDVSGKEPWWAILILFTTILVIIGLVTVVSWFVPDECRNGDSFIRDLGTQEL